MAISFFIRITDIEKVIMVDTIYDNSIRTLQGLHNEQLKAIEESKANIKTIEANIQKLKAVKSGVARLEEQKKLLTENQNILANQEKILRIYEDEMKADEKAKEAILDRRRTLPEKIQLEEELIEQLTNQVREANHILSQGNISKEEERKLKRQIETNERMIFLTSGRLAYYEQANEEKNKNAWFTIDNFKKVKDATQKTLVNPITSVGSAFISYSERFGSKVEGFFNSLFEEQEISQAPKKFKKESKTELPVYSSDGKQEAPSPEELQQSEKIEGEVRIHINEPKELATGKRKTYGTFSEQDSNQTQPQTTLQRKKVTAPKKSHKEDIENQKSSVTSMEH
jgi:hypothetical protein